jgi:hypothetical protein
LIDVMASTDAHNRRRARGRRWLALAAVATLALALGAASAWASSNIEGIWSFNGGEIGIQELSNGTYEGTVVSATTFAECPHFVGEPIWTDMSLQADGSYWGFHQWYFENSGCEQNPERGRTAWRVLEKPSGDLYLLVCLSSPGSESQPTIAADGSHSGETYGCIESELKAPLPTTGGPSPGSGSSPGSSPGGSGVAGEVERLTLPSAKKCLSARRFRIHLAEPRYDPFKTVRVTIKGHKIATAKHGNYVVATINLKRFKRGRFTIVIHVTTVLGHHLSGKRTYHTCAKHAKRHKPAKLH